MALNDTDKLMVVPNAGNSIQDADGFVHIQPLAVYQNHKLGKPLGEWAYVKAILQGDSVSKFYEDSLVTYTNGLYKKVAGVPGMNPPDFNKTNAEWEYIGQMVAPLFPTYPNLTHKGIF